MYGNLWTSGLTKKLTNHVTNRQPAGEICISITVMSFCLQTSILG
jgi:hypothetical protein